jgi:hypothetical protein
VHNRRIAHQRHGDSGRTHGWSREGEVITLSRLLSRGGHKTYSLLAAMDIHGMVTPACALLDTTATSVDGVRLIKWARTHLVPCLGNFARREPLSVVVLDNASIHHDRDFLDLILDCGATYLFLPPYSPDYNPIERGFAAIKRWIISHWVDESVVSPHAILDRALNEAVDPSTAEISSARLGW